MKFLFHTLSDTTCYTPEAFLIGKLCDANGTLQKKDKRMLTYAGMLVKDLKKFDLFELSRTAASQKCFQTNILKECAAFGNSFLASIAGKTNIVVEDDPNFPETHQHRCFLFATDGSLTKVRKRKIGAFAVVDSFRHHFVSEHPCTEKTSSTTLELLALRKLYLEIQKELDQLLQMPLSSLLVILTDSLSALRLVLGLDVRSEDPEILRDIDSARRTLLRAGIKDCLIHVRSHRNVSVALNCKADYYAGVIAFPQIEEHHKKEFEKCPPECTRTNRCSACAWNKRVNEFLQSFATGQLQLAFWN